MIKIILLSTLAVMVLSACGAADTFECSTSLCATWTFVNGSCIVDSASTCVASTSVPNAMGSCTMCSGLTSATCSSTCVDWYYSTSSTTCTNCATTYGVDCVQCSTTECLVCAYSSNKVLSANKTACVSSSCTSPCISCYQFNGTERC